MTKDVLIDHHSGAEIKGLDEAELADIDPVGKSEASKLKQKIIEHAHDPNAFEPAEAEVQRAIEEGQQSPGSKSE